LSSPKDMVPLQMGLAAMVVLLGVRSAHQNRISSFRRRPESILFLVVARTKNASRPAPK